MEIVSRSLSETNALALKLLEKLARTGQKDKATIVGLSGDLGSGKTTFTQVVARALGIRERVTSPTFVIMKSYAISPEKGETLLIGKVSPCQWPWRRLVHVDCYRLETAEELTRLGWSELTSDPANLIFIEWPERVKEILPEHYQKITFEILSKTARKITF